jgi:hypothetical protein
VHINFIGARSAPIEDCEILPAQARRLGDAVKRLARPDFVPFNPYDDGFACHTY